MENINVILSPQSIKIEPLVISENNLPQANAYSAISKLSAVKSGSQFYIDVAFVNPDLGTIRIPMGRIENHPTWTNDVAGAEIAYNEISVNFKSATGSSVVIVKDETNTVDFTADMLLSTDGTKVTEINPNQFVKKTELPSNLTLYPTDVESDISGYFKMVTSLDDPDYNSTSVDITTPEITGAGIEIARLATSVGVLLGNPGIINLTTVGNVRRISGTSEATFNYEMYHRNSLGVETLVATSGMTANVGVAIYEQFSASALLNNGDWSETDRIVIVFYGTKVGAGSNSVFQFQFGGSSPVRTILPVPASVLLDVPIQKDVTKTVDFTAGQLIGSVGGKAVGVNPSDLPVSTATQTALNAKQATLVSGTNIKTFEGVTILGNGNLFSQITINSTPVVSGTDKRVLFQNAGKVAQDGFFIYNTSARRLSVGNIQETTAFNVHGGTLATGGIITDVTQLLLNYQLGSEIPRQVITNATNNVMGGFLYPLSPNNNSLGLGIQLLYNGTLTEVARFNGVGLGMGVTSPSALIHLKASTGVAGTAPIKLTAGVNLTTPENGAFEFNGTNLYFTVGGVRKMVTLV